jgi:hypothetical protein
VNAERQRFLLAFGEGFRLAGRAELRDCGVAEREIPVKEARVVGGHDRIVERKRRRECDAGRGTAGARD